MNHIISSDVQFSAITWKDHALVGLPVTVVTLALAGAWLWLRSV